ncbi:MAG TPA: hypothetical protein DDW42_09630 [Desulfobacteraceae bacterium]|nr:hypothetical protein [Desulfobacteraceae bacterium]
MIIRYLFSSPKGDIIIGPCELSIPFKIAPSESHPFLVLGDYFEAIKNFILMNNGVPLVHVLGERLHRCIKIDSITKILIRTEKHGALYHLASVEIFAVGQRIKLAVSTAISEIAKTFLANEFDILKSFKRNFNFSYLPKAYYKDTIERACGSKKEILSIMLTDWFEDYHEWHLSNDDDIKGQQICIWDLKNGRRFANKVESFEIFRQTSKILTLYYDTKDFRQIYPWHHAAGDFVVKTTGGITDVRITTARNYEPIMVFLSENNINPMTAIIYYFLNLALKIRLDKLNGVGKVVWAKGFSVEAATTGFFEALRIMDDGDRYHLGKVGDLLLLLKAFTSKEIETLYYSMMDLYRLGDPEEFLSIQANLEDHVSRMHRILQAFRI